MGATAVERTDRLVLAADVGGTHARVGLVAVPHDPGRKPVLVFARRYECAAWSTLGAILADFRAGHPQARHVDEGALALPGYLRDDDLVAENLPWPVRMRALRGQLGLPRLRVVNDFEALAYATQFVADDDALIDMPPQDGPVVVVGPGTGLGCAALLQVGGRARVLPSEAGHVALAAGNTRERALLGVLARGRSYVHTGLVLSGPGLLNLYRALATLDGVPCVHDTPAQLTAAARSGPDPLAHESLQVFCAMLGSFAGDLAVVFKATGGVRLAGGVLPHVREVLYASDFRARFLGKGVMRDFLAQVRVGLIDHGELGVLGAASMLGAPAPEPGRPAASATAWPPRAATRPTERK